VSTDSLGRRWFSRMAAVVTVSRAGGKLRLLMGDDWAEDVRHEVACCE
jgi:hypothetical protein